MNQQPLQVDDSDIIVLRGEVDPAFVKDLALKLAEKDRYPLILCVGDSLDIEKLSESEMNLRGWYRKPEAR